LELHGKKGLEELFTRARRRVEREALKGRTVIEGEADRADKADSAGRTGRAEGMRDSRAMRNGPS